jgi:hypothetical protein
VATGFPASLDAFDNPSGEDSQQDLDHAGMHADAFDAIEALQAKVGIDNSADTDSLDYRVMAVEGGVSGLDGRVTALENSPAGGGVNPASVNGFKAWTFDPAFIGSAKQINSVGTMYIARFVATEDASISTVSICVSSAGTTSSCWAALYSAAGSLLQQSSSSVDTTTTGLKAFSLASPESITAGTIYYAAVWATAGSGQAPSLLATANAVVGGSGQFSSSVGLSSPNFRSATANTGLTSTAPSTIGTMASVDPLIWFGLS